MGTIGKALAIRAPVAQPSDEAVALNEAEAIKHLVAHIQRHHGGRQNRFAQSIAVSRAFVSDMVRGNRNLSGEVLKAVGLEIVVAYKKVSENE